MTAAHLAEVYGPPLLAALVAFLRAEAAKKRAEQAHKLISQLGPRPVRPRPPGPPAAA